MKRKLVLLLFSSLFIWMSCKDEKNVFTVEQNKVTVKAGTEFILKIISNHSTGYKWFEEAPIDSSILQLKLVDYQITDKNSDGGGGYEYWHFKALKTGETEVRLKYVQSWENLPADKMVNFKIIVE